jgi:hypothetical protein
MPQYAISPQNIALKENPFCSLAIGSLDTRQRRDYRRFMRKILILGSGMVAGFFVMLLAPDNTKAYPGPEIPRHELIIKHIFPKEDGVDHENSYIWKGSDIDIGPDGRIYVSDEKADLIHIYGPSGLWLSNFGRRGQGPGEFISPYSISATQDKIFAKDIGNRRIQAFGVDGRYRGQVKLTQSISDFVAKSASITDTDRIYACRSQDLPIVVFNAAGEIIDSFGKPLSFKRDFNVLNLASIAVDENSDVYLAYLYAPVIRKYSNAGELLKEQEMPFDFVKKYKEENDKFYGTSRYWAIFADIKSSHGSLFLMCLDKSIIRIIEMDTNLEPHKIYEIDFSLIAEDVLIRHFAVTFINEKPRFYFMEAGSIRNQVYVLAPK